MGQKFVIPTTQRAYTLRLRGPASQDASWRENLWKTHEAVNKGAKAFGDWLLTMRGGLCHTLADTRDKRIILALSWLSVESPKDSVPNDNIVATGDDSVIVRKQRLMDALREILSLRGINNADIVEQWVEACEDSLSADIRKDAVWVNRSKAFDEEVKELAGMLTRNDALSIIEEFFGKAQEYLAPLFSTEDSETDSGNDASASDNEKEFRNVARGWLSRNWGSGNKTDKRKIAANLKRVVESDLETVIGKPTNELFAYIITALGGQLPEDENEYYSAAKRTIGWITGSDSKGALIIKSLATQNYILQEDISKLRKKFNDEILEKGEDFIVNNKIPEWMANKRTLIEQEIGINFRYNRDLIGEFSVMLDHAARRVSVAHSWIKRAEAERRQFEEDASKKSRIPDEAKKWLDRFCESRSLETGSIEAYRIRKRAVDGWEEVIKKWSKSDCKTETDRIAAARSLQDDQEIDKFGDIQLFEALAADDAICVWKINDKPDPQPLRDYVAATDAEAKMLRFKVPAYRHPDSLLHPVFCDFGNSRWGIYFAIHKAKEALEKTESKAEKKRVQCDKAQNSVERARNDEQRIKAQVKLNQTKEALEKAEKELAWLHDQYGLKMDLYDGSGIICDRDAPLRWSSKRLSKDLYLSRTSSEKKKLATVTRADRLGRAAINAGNDMSLLVIGLFEQKDWNGRLQAPRQQLKKIAEHKANLSDINWFITFSAKLQPQGPWIDFAKNFNLLQISKGEAVVKPHSSKDE